MGVLSRMEFGADRMVKPELTQTSSAWEVRSAGPLRRRAPPNSSSALCVPYTSMY